MPCRNGQLSRLDLNLLGYISILSFTREALSIILIGGIWMIEAITMIMVRGCSMTNAHYRDFKELSETRKRKLGNNTYLVVRDDGGFGVRLHNTEVVIHYEDKIVLDTGGWYSVTTKARMNEYTPFHICQKDYDWYVDDMPYEDNMIIELSDD
tara:strand:- start:487 stop:945 length:459 start_codon:yes stop_codon:yes gene_type:complete